MRPLVDRSAPGLVAIHGVGYDVAAKLLMAAGDNPERLTSEPSDLSGAARRVIARWRGFAAIMAFWAAGRQIVRDHGGGIVDRNDMDRLFRTHREAEARRDYDAVIETFTEDCYLETIALGLRSEGRAAARAAYVGYFTAFPDLAPDDQGLAFGDDVIVAWGFLRGASGGDWLGVPPSGKSFVVPFTNVARFKGGLMAGESIYFDLATLCEQAGLPLDDVRASAKARAATAEAL